MLLSADPWEFGWTAVAAIATAVGSIAIIVGLGIAAAQLVRSANAARATARAAELAHVRALLRTWDGEPLEEARQAVSRHETGTQLLEAVNEYDATGDAQYFVLLRVPDFFEDLGSLVFNSEFVTSETVRHSLRPAIAYYWELFEPLTTEHRRAQVRRGEPPTIFEWFERLAKEGGTAQP
ncbi:MAG: hypothetical protein IIA54_01065 [Chloroflexi bacterium]|nr:hypothetical protein [Chloroflexota bacterium]